MPRHDTKNIRNIAFLGHAGAGKTSLIEALLVAAGALGKAGSVENKDTICDFEPEEHEHQHSLNAAFVNFDHEGQHFNLVDTPGMPDFIGQAFGVMPAVEAVGVVISADRGIQNVTRRVMKMAEQRRLPRMIVVNKIEDHAADLEQLLVNIREAFGNVCLPLNLPTPDCADVIDLWEKDAGGDVLFSSVADAHTAIVDQCVEMDEDLMAAYLEQGSLTKDQLHDTFERALREAHLIPVFFASAKTGAGVQDLLHLMASLAPSPLDGNPRPFELVEAGETKDWFPNAKADDTLVGHVFKVTADQFVGKVAMIRIHQGTFKAGASVQLGDNRKPLRIAHIHKVHGKEMQQVEVAVPGDIIAVSKVEELVYDSVIHESQNDHLETLHFKSLPMPKPMYGLAIEAKSHGDETKIGTALHKLVEEDPTFRVERIAATKQTVARALGELHMRVIMEKLHNRFKLDLETTPPRVAYKETITSQAEGHHRHKKQTGGAGQFGEVHLKVEPMTQAEMDEKGDILDFVDDTVGGSIPRQFMPAIEKGIRQALEHGAVAGYPMEGVRVRVFDGKHHPVDSKEVAFITAGKKAFIDAVNKARPVLLEPVCDVEVSAPSSAMGDITANLSTKRGQVGETDYLPGEMVVIHAKVPLSEMGRYSSELKSVTAGQGSFVMDYSHDEPTPPNVQQEIIAAYKPEDDD